MSRSARSTWSEYLLYALVLVQPLTGWAPHSIDAFAVLRECHDAFAFLLFETFPAHMCAVLFHTLVLLARLLWSDRRTAARPSRAVTAPILGL